MISKPSGSKENINLNKRYSSLLSLGNRNRKDGSLTSSSLTFRSISTSDITGDAQIVDLSHLNGATLSATSVSNGNRKFKSTTDLKKGGSKQHSTGSFSGPPSLSVSRSIFFDIKGSTVINYDKVNLKTAHNIDTRHFVFFLFMLFHLLHLSTYIARTIDIFNL